MQKTAQASRVASSELFAADDSFFLSEVNATATVEQRELESLALELLDSERIVAARERAEQMFRILGGKYGARAPDEALGKIDQQMREWTFHYLLLSLNYDRTIRRSSATATGRRTIGWAWRCPAAAGPGTAETPTTTTASSRST